MTLGGEWTMEDYRAAMRQREEEGLPELSFGDWLATQLPEYRLTHGVAS